MPPKVEIFIQSKEKPFSAKLIELNCFSGNQKHNKYMEKYWSI